jgi:hypothetical protein
VLAELSEKPLSLHPLLEDAQGLIHIVLSDKNEQQLSNLG